MDIEHRLSKVLSEFARTLVTDFSIQAILDELVVRIVEILPITAAGVTLISPRSDPRYIAASDDSALRYEQLQSELGEGPCMAAYETGEAVAIPDLRENDRFPSFGPRAVKEGLAAVFTFPLRDGKHQLGALDLYRATPGTMDAEAMDAAQSLADVAAAYLMTAQARDDLRLSAEVARVEQMKRIEEAHTDFVSKVSHELRSPLTTVIGYVELLVDGAPGTPNDEQKDMLGIIDRNSRRLLDLIEELLIMSRVEDGSFALEVGPIDLPEIVGRVRQAVALTVLSSELELTVELASDVELAGDPVQLERALLNLVSNAVKFTRPGGRVEIAARTEDDRLALSSGRHGNRNS